MPVGKHTTVFLLGTVYGIWTLQHQAVLPVQPLLYLGAGVLLFGFASISLSLLHQYAFHSSVFRMQYIMMLFPIIFVISGILGGFGWAGWRAELRLAEQFDPVWIGRDIQLSGEIATLPQTLASGGVRFTLRVRHVDTPGIQVPERILLSIYPQATRKDASMPDPATLLPGAVWQFTVRLKPPHGMVNPDGYDYEAWLLEQGIRATGYIRSGKILTPPRWWPPMPVMQTVHLLRYHLRGRLSAHFSSDPTPVQTTHLVSGESTRNVSAPYSGILIALVMGDQRAIDDTLWQVFNRTGTTHLMSISGLHVTLLAGLVGMLVHRIWCFWPRLCLHYPARKAALCSAWLTALIYGLLAGWGIPTQRTCLMLSLAVLALLSERRVGSGRILLGALVLVVWFDPWAVLAPGFWLSFGTVAALLWVSQASTGAFTGWRAKFRGFAQTQWAATLATLPVLIVVFQQFPLTSPLANLVAIPVVSFLIIPLTLAGTLLIWVPGQPFLDWAHSLLSALMQFLHWLAKAPLWQPPVAPTWAFLAALAGILLLLMPRGVHGKLAGVSLLLPLLFWPRSWPDEGQLQVTVLDVGQGQAVLLETARHTLLYDTGPAMGEQDAGGRIILPFLTRKGITRLDMLVLSHRDKDHAGGLETLQNQIKITELRSSLPEQPSGQLCRQGQVWVWEGVRFEFLHPEPNTPLKGRNEDSCVLRVETSSGRLLLNGDAGRREEWRMVREHPEKLASEVILVPHHGSTTSSSQPFVEAVNAQTVLISAGYANAYQHPRPEILERYEKQGGKIWRTDIQGALLLDFSAGAIKISGARDINPRYWWKADTPVTQPLPK